MAGDWIKFECVTPDKPEISIMAEELGIDMDAVTGKLLRFWIWADQQSVDGNALSVTDSFIDRITFSTGFAEALRSVGWLAGKSGAVTLPNFDLHNGKTAKKRAQTNRRVAASRSTPKVDECNATTVTESEQKALPEKRREEKSTDKNTCPQTDGEKESKPDPDAELLKTVWNLFPQIGRGRSSKKQFYNEWKKIKKADKPTLDELVTSLTGWIACHEWKRDNGQAIQGIHLWVKNEKWNNTPEKQNATPTNQSSEYVRSL